MIDTSQLTHILNIDTDTKTALVEPNVPMDRLVEATLRHGLIPPVVMEFPGITVGGGFSGTSGESSSFRNGFFEHCVKEVQMVLANGELVTASGTEREDLFYGAASSFGTLGVITLLKLRLIEGKKYVALTYYPVSSVAQAMDKVKEATKDTSVDYLDGIIYSKDRGVICVGKLTDTLLEGTEPRTFSRATDPWFCLHAKELIETSSPGESINETIPLTEYLFRYDRGGFWVGSFAFQYFLTPFNRFTRWALDDFLHTRVMYHALHQSGLVDRYVIQDVGIPYEGMEEFVEYLDTKLGYYPLWLCPLYQPQQWQRSAISCFKAKGATACPDRFMNLGIWGVGPRNRGKFIELNRDLENKVQELKGKKWLYGHTYYTEEEFWNIYNRTEYEKLREKYHATYLPSVFDKVKVDFSAEENSVRRSLWARVRAMVWMIWPLRGLYGLFRASIGGDYLLPRYWWNRKS